MSTSKKGKKIRTKKAPKKSFSSEPIEEEDVVETEVEHLVSQSSSEITFQLRLKIPNCCCVCFSRFDQENPVFPIQEICDHHLNYDNHLDENELIKLTSELKKPDLRRICQACFEASINSNAEEPEITKIGFYCPNFRVSLKCPLCLQQIPSAKMDQLMGELSPECLKRVAFLLSEKRIEREYPAFYCPVTQCDYREYVETFQDRKGKQQINCPKHGSYCTSCHQPYRLKHTCDHLPDEVRSWKHANMLRFCPNCSEPIKKHGGCNDMECQACGYSFHWRREGRRVIPKENPFESTHRRRHRIY